MYLSELSQWQPLLYCRLMTDFSLCYTIRHRSFVSLWHAIGVVFSCFAASTLFLLYPSHFHSTLFVTFILIVFAIFENIHRYGEDGWMDGWMVYENGVCMRTAEAAQQPFCWADRDRFRRGISCVWVCMYFIRFALFSFVSLALFYSFVRSLSSPLVRSSFLFCFLAKFFFRLSITFISTHE